MNEAGMNKKIILVVLFGLLASSSWALLMHMIMGGGFVVYLLVGVLVCFSFLGVRGILRRKSKR